MSNVISILTRKPITELPHQAETFIHLLSHKRFYNLSEMGTGKTLPATKAINALFEHGAVKRILAVAPLSVIRAAWEEHMESFAAGVPMMLMDVAAKRKKQVKQLGDFNGLVLINPEGVETVFHDLRAWCPKLIVIDELAGYYRNTRTKRWKAMKLLLHMSQAACWAFTGTPTTRDIMDSYAQCLLVNPSGMPKGRNGGPVSYKQYRDILCNQPYPNVWVPKPDALKRVYGYMQPAVRYTRAETMKNVPEPVHIRKDVALTPEQQKMLDEMMREGKARYGSQIISAKEARALRTKLVQIVTGSIYDTRGNVVEVPCNPRIQALIDLHAEVEYSPIIVAVPFIHTNNRLERVLKEKGYRVGVIIGDVKPTARAEIIQEVQAGNIDFLLVHPKTLAHGVTLTRSHTVCWYGPIDDYELVAQLDARISRYGQEHKPLIVELCSTGAERKMYASLKNKERMLGNFLDLFGG